MVFSFLKRFENLIETTGGREKFFDQTQSTSRSKI